MGSGRKSSALGIPASGNKRKAPLPDPPESNALASPDAVGVLISMNGSAYTIAPLPHKNDWDIPVSSLGQYTDLINLIKLALR